MRIRHWFWLACLAPAMAIAQSGANATEEAKKVEIIDRAVASINGHLITLSQLEFEARVLFIHAGEMATAFEPLELSASLNAIIDERLATLHADKLESNSAELKEVEEAIASFRSRFASEAHFHDFLAQHEADLTDVSDVLLRSLRAQRALQAKLRLRVQVTQRDIESQRASEPKLEYLTDAAIKQRLTEERFQQLVKRELEIIERNVDVRLHGPFRKVRALHRTP